jgi:CRP-like cAMP-binding protein
MTWEFHLANALLLISYAVKEILWLRLVTCIAGLSALAALWRAEPAPPHAAFVWQLTFFAINIARLAQLVHERRPVPLPPDAKRLATSVFPTLRPRELLRLLAVGEILEHAPGTRLVEKGTTLDHLAVVIDGTARVELVDARTVELAHGAFIGELSYLTGKPPAADVVAAGPLRVVRWPTASLRSYLAAHPDTRAVMQLVLGSDLATKLRRQPAAQ